MVIKNIEVRVHPALGPTGLPNYEALVLLRGSKHRGICFSDSRAHSLCSMQAHLHVPAVRACPYHTICDILMTTLCLWTVHPAVHGGLREKRKSEIQYPNVHIPGRGSRAPVSHIQPAAHQSLKHPEGLMTVCPFQRRRPGPGERRTGT